MRIDPGMDADDVLADPAAYLVAHDIEGVLVDIQRPYRDYAVGFMADRDPGTDPAELRGPGIAPLVDHFASRHPAYEPDHLFGELGASGTVAEQYPGLADTPYADFVPFHARVDGFWRADAAAVASGGDRSHLDPTEADLPGSLRELRGVVEDRFGETGFHLVTGRPGVQDEMRTVLADMGIAAGREYDALHVVPDDGPEDKLDKSFDMYVDDSPGRPVNATGDDIVLAYDHPRNDAHRGYDRARSVGVPSIDAASHTVRWLADTL